jgi:hypothetical protein
MANVQKVCRFSIWSGLVNYSARCYLLAAPTRDVAILGSCAHEGCWLTSWGNTVLVGTWHETGVLCVVHVEMVSMHTKTYSHRHEQVGTRQRTDVWEHNTRTRNETWISKRRVIGRAKDTTASNHFKSKAVFLISIHASHSVCPRFK